MEDRPARASLPGHAQNIDALLKSPWIPGPSLICIWCVTPASLWVSSGGETQKQRNVKKET